MAFAHASPRPPESYEAVERSLAEAAPRSDALDRLSALGAPTGDLVQMLAEIEAGRG
jgi:hypothetical protein